MSMLITMEILRVIILLLPFSFYSILCFPTRPLNERSTELAWQAWLLVDDQNQNKQSNPESFTRRRITPKSVFIAPKFSPESLEACADGYRPDSMGRCIRIIKLDEEAHLDFLLEKLNAQFGDYDEMENDAQETLPTAGPFQLNIPLNETPEEDSDDSMDIAIVVAPTNGNFALDDKLKSAVKRTSTTNEEDAQKKLPDIENRFPEVDARTEITSTSETESTPTSTTNFIETTTIPTADTTSPTSTLTIPTETTTLEIETDTSPISEQQQQALFFLHPSLINANHVQNGINNTEDTPTDDSLMTTTTVPGMVRFPAAEEELTYRIDYVKFPDRVTQSHNLPQNYATERPFNHRNRDKNSHFWSVPPSWRESSPQKPIVLRFSRKSNSRHLYEEHLRPNAKNYETFYREVPSEDFSYIFGLEPHSRRKNRR